MRVFFILCWATALLASARSQALPRPQGDKLEPAIAEGQVISASTGEPVVRARVTLRPTTETPNAENAPGGFTMETDEQGTFHFEKLEPGKYDLSVTKTGYLRASYGAKRAKGPGIPILLTSGQTTGKLDVKLYPAGTVAGVVTDDHGEPLQCNVELMKRVWRQAKPTFMPIGSTVSDATGHFRISEVEPGKYLLQAKNRRLSFGRTEPVEVDRQGNPINSHLVMTFLGDTTRPESATLIQVQPGQEITDANIRLQRGPTFHVNGKVVSPLPSDSPSSYMTYLTTQEGWFLSSGIGGRPAKDGQFSIENVQPGSYLLRVEKMGAGGGSASIPVEVSNSNIENLEVSIQPNMEISGKIVVESHPEADVSSTDIYLTAQSSTLAASVNAADGSFKLSGVTPSRYALHVHTPEKASFVKSVHLGDRDVDRHSIDLTQGAGDLDIMLSFSTATVTGEVVREDTDSQVGIPASAVNVVLIPDQRVEDLYGGVQFVSTDGQGRFTFKGLEPGKYKAYAADGIDSEQWTDPELAAALSADAVEVDLKEGDSKHLPLKLITAAESAALLQRLGL